MSLARCFCCSSKIYSRNVIYFPACDSATGHGELWEEKSSKPASVLVQNLLEIEHTRPGSVVGGGWEAYGGKTGRGLLCQGRWLAFNLLTTDLHQTTETAEDKGHHQSPHTPDASCSQWSENELFMIYSIKEREMCTLQVLLSGAICCLWPFSSGHSAPTGRVAWN